MGINISEAAREWNISRGTIYRKCKTGEMSRMQGRKKHPKKEQKKNNI